MEKRYPLQNAILKKDTLDKEMMAGMHAERERYISKYPRFYRMLGRYYFFLSFLRWLRKQRSYMGIVVNSEAELERFPKMAQNWTSKIKVFISPKIEIKSSYQNELTDSRISVYRGTITKVIHTNTKVESVLLESGETIEVEALLWIPPIKPAQLIKRLVENLGLELDELGYVKSDMMQQTNVKGLFAVGDVKGSMGAITAAQDGAVAAVSIAHEWYH